MRRFCFALQHSTSSLQRAGSGTTASYSAGSPRAYHATPAGPAARWGWLPLAIGVSGGAACGGVAAIGLGLGQPATEAITADASGIVTAMPLKTPTWALTLFEQPGIITGLNLDRHTPHKGPVSADHWFSSLVKHQHVQHLSMLYDPDRQRFFSVVKLGRDVCGYPSIVHGGLTAATFDETFGGLLFALRNQGRLPFWGPAFTAQLEITYISRITADTTILCTAEVESIEGRKVWMRAVMSDGPEGKVYATSRVLFVAPKPHRLLRDILRWATSSEWFPNRVDK